MELNKELLDSIIAQFESQNKGYFDEFETKFEQLISNVNQQMADFHLEFAKKNMSIVERDIEQVIHEFELNFLQFIDKHNLARFYETKLGIGSYPNLIYVDVNDLTKTIFEFKCLVVNSYLMGYEIIALDKFLPMLEKYYFNQLIYNIYSAHYYEQIQHIDFDFKSDYNEVFLKLLHQAMLQSIGNLDEINVKPEDLYHVPILIKSITNSIIDRHHVLNSAQRGCETLYNELDKFQLLKMNLQEFIASFHAGFLNITVINSIVIDCRTLNTSLNKVFKIFAEFQASFIGTDKEHRTILMNFIINTCIIIKADGNHFNMTSRTALNNSINKSLNN